MKHRFRFTLSAGHPLDRHIVDYLEGAEKGHKQEVIRALVRAGYSLLLDQDPALANVMLRASGMTETMRPTHQSSDATPVHAEPEHAVTPRAPENKRGAVPQAPETPAPTSTSPRPDQGETFEEYLDQSPDIADLEARDDMDDAEDMPMDALAAVRQKLEQGA